MDWKPDRNSKETIQNQIIKKIREMIVKGELKPGQKLLPERKLAALYQVNRSTISYVLCELKSRGLIESRGTKGTFVSDSTWSRIASSAYPNWDEYINYSIHKPNQKIIQKINRYEFEKGIIRLGTGELSPELFPKDLMEKVLLDLSKTMDSMNYEEAQGLYELRAEIARYLKNYDLDMKPEEILITSGSLQAFHLISIGLLQPGSTIYVERPSYLKSLHVFQSAGMNLRGIPMKEDGLDLEYLKKNLKKSGTNLLYTIPTYQNPTGILMGRKKRQELMDFIRENRIPVIEDDAYRELYLEEEPPPPLKSMDQSGNVIYSGTLSKVFSPGIRIGWLAGPQAVMERLGDIKMQTDYGSSSISQKIALEWIGKGYYEKYRDRLRSVLLKRRRLVLELLDRHFSDIASWNSPKGGFYIWVKLDSRINSTRLFNECLEEKILINPGSIYDFDENSAIRLSYAYATEEELVGGIEKLSKIIRRL